MASSFYLNALMARPGIAETLADNINRRAAAERQRQDKEAAREAIKQGYVRSNQEAEEMRQQRILGQLPEEMRQDQSVLETVRKSPLAVAYEGKVYSDIGAAEAARKAAALERAKEAKIKERADELKAIDTGRDEAIRRIRERAAKTPDQLRALGWKDEDITPEVLDKFDTGFANSIENLKEEALAAKAQAEGLAGNKTPAGRKAYNEAVAKYNSMLEQYQSGKGLADDIAAGRTSAGSAYSEQMKSFRKSIDADALASLQEYLVNSPSPVADDPRVYQAFRERSLQKSMPELVDAFAIEPELGKTFMESLKTDSRQGDAGFASERKVLSDELKNAVSLMRSSITADASKDALSQRVSGANALLKFKEQELAWKKKNASDKNDIARSKLDVDRYRIVANNTTALALRQMADETGLTVASINKMTEFTDEQRDQVERYIKMKKDAGLPLNANEVLGLFPDFFRGGQRAAAAPKQLGSKEGADQFIGTGPRQATIELAPLPPVKDIPGTGAAKGKGAAKATLTTTERPLPKGWTEKRQLTDGTWIARDPQTKKFKRY